MIYLTTTPINLSLPLMPKIDKKAKYDEFTVKDGKCCIGGNEILKIWHGSTNGWYWYATKANTKQKIPITYEGYVKGLFDEWGSWFASDMDDPSIKEIPKENWNICIP